MATKPKPIRAISIRQPYAEQILQGKKRKEFRSVPTKIRERVYIYASLTPADESGETLVRGKIVGSVEIVDCVSDGDGGYAYKLDRPERLARPLKPRNKPQPIWFRPF